jgi:VanZ family protein
MAQLADAGNRKTRKWLAVALFTLVIFATLPFGPAIRNFLTEHFGKWFVIWFVGISLLAGVVTIFAAVLRRERKFSVIRFLWLLLIVFLYWQFLKRTFRVPIESVHFIEYGILSVLAYRALRESYAETWIFVLVIVFTYTVGIADELIQWVLPNRVAEIRDVLFNAVSGVLAQIFLWKVVVPPGLTKGVPARSFRPAVWLAAFNIVLTGSFLELVNGFGHRTVDPDVGSFFSRMTPEEILEIDRARGPEHAAVLDSAYEGSYDEFLRATSDPFLYEMRVHLFRRDSHFEKGSHRVACCEQKLLDKYFTTTLENSRYRWRKGEEKICRDRENDCARYRSPVSQEIIVRFEHVHLWTFVSVVSGFLFVLGTRRRFHGGMEGS